MHATTVREVARNSLPRLYTITRKNQRDRYIGPPILETFFSFPRPDCGSDVIWLIFHTKTGATREENLEALKFFALLFALALAFELVCFASDGVVTYLMIFASEFALALVGYQAALGHHILVCQYSHPARASKTNMFKTDQHWRICFGNKTGAVTLTSNILCT